MAETLYFSIPAAEAGQPDPFHVVWYQSDDGFTWDGSPVDTAEISSLSIDPETGKYIWTTNAPNPYRFHYIKTQAIDFTESLDGIIVAPEDYATLAYDSDKISDGLTIYSPGQTIDLMLKVDPSIVSTLGLSIPVRIVDNWGSPVGFTTATQIAEGTGFYTGQFTIPSDVERYYNLYNESEEGLSADLFYLKDIWLFENNSQVSYNIYVSKANTASAVTKDSLYSVDIRTINGQEVLQSVQFTSELTKYYAPVEDILSLMPGLKGTDVFSLVRQILNRSQYVDVHMKPNVIYDIEAYNSAVRCFVARQVAMDLVFQESGLTSETVTLDTMQVSKSYDSGVRHTAMNLDASACMNIIYAGGKDTPFHNRLFVKGINDPNRPQVSRGRFNESSRVPYLNYSSKPVLLIGTAGELIEYRGERTIEVV